MKRSILLFAMLFLAIILKAKTQPVEPLDTDGNSYRNISTLAHLRWVSENSSCWKDNLELDNDINASDTKNWNMGKAFSPIGESEANSFTGIIDGNGFKIDSLFINRPNQFGVGLFGYFKGSIRNLVLLNCEIKGQVRVGGLVGYGIKIISLKDSYVIGNIEGESRVGGLVGSQHFGEIINCFTDVNIIAESIVGGLVGEGSEIKFLNCNSNGNIIANSLIGGLIGSGNTLEFVRCYSNANIIGLSIGTNALGGLVGACSDSYISECYATGNIKGDSLARAGGLIGVYSISSRFDYKHISNLTNSYARGNVVGNANLGGLIGELRTDKDSVNILNCYSTGKVSINKGSGGLIGDVELFDNAKLANVISNCFWDIQTSNYDSSAGGTGRISSQMKTRSTYIDSLWDFNNIWSISTFVNDGYPNLSRQNQEVLTLVSPDSTKIGLPLYFNFYWKYIIGAEYYQLQVSKNVDFTDLVFSKDSLELHNPIDGKVGYPITDLEYNTKYFWRVRAWSVETYDLSKWSVIWYFTTGTNSVSDNLGLEINIIPNPISKGQILTIMDIPIELREYSVKIFDLNSTLIKSYVNINQIEVTNNYSIGTYVIIIESDNKIILTKKFIVK